MDAEKLTHLDLLDTQNRNIGVQTLMAIREAAIMADLTPSQIEDLFCNNAMALFHGK